jgi:hypothetical protein
VDLCTAVWQSGEAVLNTPRSRVRHYRSASTRLPFRHFLVRRNGALFREKWAARLALYESAEPGSPDGIQRALVRAAERWRNARPAGAAEDANGPAIGPPRGRADSGAHLATAYALHRDWAEEVQGELERLVADRDLAAAATRRGLEEAVAERDRALAERDRALAAAEADRARAEEAERERELAEARARAAAEAAEEGARRSATELAALRERNRLLAAIERGRWWRLYGRLLPLLRVVRRLSRRAGASRRG